MNKDVLIHLLIFLIVPLTSNGQELRFRQFTMEDGLSNEGTYWLESIIQDREGFMWFTTFNGLNRFDGTNFKKFQYNQNSPNGLGDNFTTSICEADDGKIWVGSSSGVYIFDPKSETFESYRNVPTDPRSLCSNDINFIQKDQAGNMWIGTAADGVCRWSKTTKEFENFDGYFRDGLVFFQQKNGTIWIGNTQGLFQKIEGKDQFIYIETPEDFKTKNIRFASDIVELPDGSLMVSSNNQGLWTYNPETKTFNDITESYKSKLSKAPTSLLADKAGTIWMGAIGEVHQYDPNTGHFKVHLHDKEDPASVPLFTVAYGYQDAAGSLWFITPGGGVIVSHSPHHPFQLVGDIDVGEAVKLDENRLLINGWEKMGVFDINENKILSIDEDLPNDLLNTPTLSIAISGENELWIQQQNEDHVKVYNIEKKEIRQIPGRVSFLKTGTDGRIWTGFKYYDEELNRWVEVSPNIPDLQNKNKFGKAVTDLFFSDNDIVWLSTNFGIFQYSFQTQKGRKYDLHPGENASASVVHRIYPGEGGRFYLSTSNGMSMYDPILDDFLHYNENTGLLHNQATGIIEDDKGNTWISSPKGIHRLERESGDFTDYDINDGLPGTLFTYQRPYKDDTGHLFFSIAGKLIRFHPDSLKPRDYVAPLHLLNFYLNHEKIQTLGQDSLLENQLRFSQKVQLTHNQADFGFSYVMPIFYKANEVQYYYQLAPYDVDWKSAGTRNEIHYTNIPPGNYIFRVKAKTADGLWSPNDASISIRISPPFYRTWWAYLIYLIAAGSILFGIRRFEIRRQSIKAESKRLKDLDTLKTRLYTNITHEFRTPLTVIMGMADNISGHDNARELIHRNSKNLLRLINQLLDLSKLDSGTMKMDMVQSDIIIYLQYLAESFQSMAHEKKVKLIFHAEIAKLVMDYDEVKIQHLFYNLMSNALKFTKEGGQVEIHTLKTERNGLPFLKLIIKDTGSGIPEDQLSHIFDRFYQADNSNTRKGDGTGIGLALTKELIELMGGTITVNSQLGKGTSFTLLLPIRIEADTPLPQKDLRTSSSHARKIVNNSLSDEKESGSSKESVEDKPVLLIIEDNTDVINYVVSLLHNDYEIHTAPNGKTGIDHAFEIVPDIIISDVMMPEKDGYEVCEFLKTDERTNHIPIILLTAKAEESDRITGLRKGADAFLMKPFNKEELIVRLEKLLEIRRSLQKRYGSTSSHITASSSGTAKPAEPTLNDLFLQKIRKAIQDKMDNSDLGIQDLCQSVNLSYTQVFRKLKAITGENPTLYIRRMRLQKAVILLKTTQKSISQIAYEVGFSDPNYFSRVMHEEFGIPPSEMRK